MAAALFSRLFGGDARKLYQAAAAGDLASVRALVERGADVNARVGETTVLAAAATNNHVEVVRFLLKSGADPNARLDRERTPIMVCTKPGHADTVKALLDAGAAVDVADVNGVTPLMCVAQTVCAEAIQAILKAGANLEARDAKGRTALHVAADEWTNYTPLKGLLSAGADPNVADLRGTTPLMLTALHGSCEHMRLLLAKKADPNASDADGVTALHRACACPLYRDIIPMLLKAGADPSVKVKADAEGIKDARSLAMTRDMVDRAALRLALGVPLSPVATRDLQQPALREKSAMETALTLAVRSGKLFAVEGLLHGGADPALEVGQGRTAVTIAEELGSKGILQVLRDALARPRKPVRRPQPAKAQACASPSQSDKSAKCDICLKPVAYGEGFCLTTRQVVTREAYWQIILQRARDSSGQLPPEKVRAMCMRQIKQSCERHTGWLVCDRCLRILSDVDPQKAKECVKHYWQSYDTGEYVPPDGGAVPVAEALPLAARAWRRATGREPPRG